MQGGGGTWEDIAQEPHSLCDIPNGTLKAVRFQDFSALDAALLRCDSKPLYFNGKILTLRKKYDLQTHCNKRGNY